jgi:hypothetical protein
VCHVLSFFGGFLLTKGIVDDATLSQVIGSLVSLLGVVWSVVDKKPSQK